MKTKYDFRLLSDIYCNHSGCEKRLKKRLVEIKQLHNIVKCWRHYNCLRQKGMSHRHAVGARFR